MNSVFRVPTALFAGLLLAGLAGVPLAGQDADAARSADLVRAALGGSDDGEAWAALESEAMAAADGPFVLRGLRARDGGLLLELGGYGLPTLEQVMKAGAPTRVVVSLPGARTSLPHGYAPERVSGFVSVRVRQAPFGVEVEAELPPGTAAVLDEDGAGVAIRPVTPAAEARGALPTAASVPALMQWTARTWLDGLRAGRPLALFPLAAVAALALLALTWMWGRRRPSGAAWQATSDARRLADRLAPSVPVGSDR